MRTSRRDAPLWARPAPAEEHTLSTQPDTTTSLTWALTAARAADDHLGVDTVVIDVGPVLAVTDYFVITGGENVRQVKAIVDDIEEKVAAEGGPRPLRVEGLDSLEWVLLDYGPFVVHVFSAEQRAFYKLDRLWADCEKVSFARSE